MVISALRRSDTVGYSKSATSGSSMPSALLSWFTKSVRPMLSTPISMKGTSSFAGSYFSMMFSMVCLRAASTTGPTSAFGAFSFLTFFSLGFFSFFSFFFFSG